MKTGKYEGYIFLKDHTSLVSIQDQKETFTPNLDDVALAERILSSQVTALNIDRTYQRRRCPRIDKNLKKYIRQYFGFINANNEKIIVINCVWGKSDEDVMQKIDKTMISYYGGCSYFWNTKCNLSAKKLYELRVNESD